MKLKLILILIAFFVFAQNSSAQTDYRGKLEFNLSVDQTEWNFGSRIMANITVKNLSDEKLEITLMPNFELVKKDIARGEFLFANTYTPNEMPETPLEFFLIELAGNESRTIEFEISKMSWIRSNESGIGGLNWYYGVPKDEYEFYYWFVYDFVIDDKPRYGTYSTNKITVKLNSEK